MQRRITKLAGRIAVVALIGLAYLASRWLGPQTAPRAPESPPGIAGPAESAPSARAEARGDIEQAFRSGTSGVMVEATGSVDRVLADDNEGSRHQRFIVRLASGHTVLVAHNIDLARRVPLEQGDAITIHGQFEWNDLGGVVHWTHHDPRGRHPGGWIRHRGREYR